MDLLGRKIFSVLCSVVTSLCAQNDFYSLSEKEMLIEDQKRYIGKLTGELTIDDNFYLKSRGTAKQRKIARNYLKKMISEISLEAKEQRYRMPNVNPAVDLLINPYKGGNVYAILPATISTNDYVVIGGHFDSEPNSPGAIDNATGIVMAHSIVKKLKALTTRKKNVVLVFFDQEEEDNVGSKAFIRLIRRMDWNIDSAHSFDMMGWDGNDDGAIEIALPSVPLRKRYLAHAKLWEKKMFETKVNSSDYYSFILAGYNTIGVGECYGNNDTTPYIHTPEDSFKTVNFEYLADSTLFIYNVIKEILTE